MQGEYQQQLKQILQKLHLNSIDQLLQLQTISIDKISSRSNVHSLIVQQYLLRIHQIALKTQLLQRKIYTSPLQQQKLIKLQQIYPNYNINFSLNLEQAELLQVLGRANSGKTYFLINCIKQALQKNIQPILLSSSSICSQEYISAIGRDKLMIFQFQNIGELAMLVHIIGNQILATSYNQQLPSQTRTKKYLLLIDTLSQIQSQDQPIQFDCSQKFRRLISIFTTRTQTSIIYTYRVNNSLYQTQYKKQYHRPKCKNSKQWDGWAGKNLILDFVVRKRDGRYVGRLGICKGLDCRVYQAVL